MKCPGKKENSCLTRTLSTRCRCISVGPFYPVRVVYGDNTVICVDYETDENALLSYIPEDFELKEPVVSVQYTNCRDVDWMIGESTGSFR